MKKLLGVLMFTVFTLALWPLSPARALTPTDGTFTDGPYPSTSNDSGTCGNDWALDLFNRNFVVTLPGNNGTYTVRETFDKGRFLTFGGQSPAACDGSYIEHGTLIKAGVNGKFEGALDFVVSDGLFNDQGACELNENGLCGTAGWIHGFFGDQATFVNSGFKFTYQAKKQDLTYHKWVNAGTQNTGDISSV